jgi:hypothetical protein
LSAISGLKMNGVDFDLFVGTADVVHDERGNPVLSICEYDPGVPDTAIVLVSPVSGGDIFALIAACLDAHVHTEFPRVLDEAADLLGRIRSVPVRKATKKPPVGDIGSATANWD